MLVERGLAESRAQAQALVMAGQVPGYDKPGQQVDEHAALTVARGPAYVSRGGDKLAHGLDGDLRIVAGEFGELAGESPLIGATQLDESTGRRPIDGGIE